MVEILEKARKAGKTINKQILANASTLTGTGSAASGIFNHKLAALRHFNLIEGGNNSLTFTPLADRILSKDKNSLKIAFLAPDSFLNMYGLVEKNTPLSTDLLEQVANLQVGISEVGKARFVKNFIKSGIYADLIQYSLRSKNEILILDEDTPAHTEEQPALPASDLQKAELKTSKGRAVLIVPEELTKEDKTRLKSQIDLF